MEITLQEGIETVWDRLEKQQPQCGFGQLEACCNIDPLGKRLKTQNHTIEFDYLVIKTLNMSYKVRRFQNRFFETVHSE